jgi:hypothetical protein
MYLTVFRMLSAIVSLGRHPRLRTRSHFRKMKGLSPIHPCEPPEYVRKGETPSSFVMMRTESLTLTYSSVPRLRMLTFPRHFYLATTIASTQSFT